MFFKMVLCVFSCLFLIQAQEDSSVLPKETPVDDYYSNKEDDSSFPQMEVVNLKRNGRYLLGRVVDAKGEPLIGALIKAVGKKGAPPFAAASRRNGEFHIMAPPGDEYTLVVTMTKYRKLEKKVD